MAKRVFELAKELGVKSKVILDKCKDEGIPNMNNHMSSVSAGLEATVREWFGGEQAAEDSAESSERAAEKAPAEKARVEPKAAKVKSKAKAKAKPKPKPRKVAESEAEDQPGAETETATAVADEPRTGRVAPGRSGRATPPSKPGDEARSASTRPDEPDASTDDKEAEREAERKADDAIQERARPAAAAPDSGDEDDAQTHSPRKGDAPDEGGSPGGEAPQTDEPEADRPSEVKRGAPPMNVPSRPKDVRPAGEKLDSLKPAKLSGPRVVRVEAPERMQAPRSRPPADGGGRGPVRPDEAAGPDDEAGRSARRNKRRAGPGGGPGSGPGGGGGARRGGRGGGGGGSLQGDRGGAGAGWRKQDLIERDARLSRSGGFLRQRRREIKKRQQQPSGEKTATPADVGGKVEIAEPFTIKDLSAATGVKASDIIKRLFMEGVMATVNSGIDAVRAQELMAEYDIDLVVQEAKSAEEVVKDAFDDREMVDERPRSPVVTILGHVDHGKTSLLDRIRNAKVAEGEAGGITQATSAFRVPVRAGDEEKNVVFVDTPGHQAFTAMRARGAHMTDIVVLVIAADDGVMPQTVESISHAKAAGVPIVIALNKIDKPEATDTKIQQIYGQLAEHELNPVEWGGETEIVKTSAIEGKGIDEMLELLDYQAQLLELKADFGGHAQGTVIEARPMEGRGPVANVLVQQGELKVGDFIVVGRAYGRVRDLMDDRGKRIESASPSMPVQISGIDELPDAGDNFYVVDSLKKAQEAAEQRRFREREQDLAKPKVTLETMFSQMAESKVAELLVVIKADVQGSVDVLKNSAEEIGSEDVRVRVLHAAVGGITESDVLLADASDAVIIGFNVIASAKARQLAEQKNVQIRSYQVIYNIMDDLKKAAAGLLAPEIRQEVLGHAEVRDVFRITKVGAVAGCYVTDGVVERNAFIRVTRGDIVIENDRVLEQLKRFKDDAKEVRAGQECGMKIAGYDDIKVGDILECYRKVEVAREL